MILSNRGVRNYSEDHLVNQLNSEFGLAEQKLFSKENIIDRFTLLNRYFKRHENDVILLCGPEEVNLFAESRGIKR